MSLSKLVDSVGCDPGTVNFAICGVELLTGIDFFNPNFKIFGWSIENFKIPKKELNEEENKGNEKISEWISRCRCRLTKKDWIFNRDPLPRFRIENQLDHLSINANNNAIQCKFDENIKKYCIIGNTFQVKDKIKEAGGIWNKEIKGWIFDENPIHVMIQLQQGFVKSDMYALSHSVKTTIENYDEFLCLGKRDIGFANKKFGIPRSTKIKHDYKDLKALSVYIVKYLLTKDDLNKKWLNYLIDIENSKQKIDDLTDSLLLALYDAMAATKYYKKPEFYSDCFFWDLFLLNKYPEFPDRNDNALIEEQEQEKEKEKNSLPIKKKRKYTKRKPKELKEQKEQNKSEEQPKKKRKYTKRKPKNIEESEESKKLKIVESIQPGKYNLPALEYFDLT